MSRILFFRRNKFSATSESWERTAAFTNRRFPIKVRKQSGDVVLLVRTLLSHRHNRVSDLKISNLVRLTSVRPVTVSAISLHFPKLVVRSLEHIRKVFRDLKKIVPLSCLIQECWSWRDSSWSFSYSGNGAPARRSAKFGGVNPSTYRMPKSRRMLSTAVIGF